MRQQLDTAAPVATVRVAVAGPWDPREAAAFAFGPHEASPDGTVRLAFVRDDLAGHAGAVVHPRPGAVDVELRGDVPDPAATAAQAARILSLDRDARPWADLAASHPVLGAVHSRHPGLRPVLFGSPWEAAAWAVLSQRRQAAQARTLRRRLAEALGASFSLDGATLHALPTPRAVLDAPDLPVPATPAARLRGLARAALDGALDPAVLRGLPAADALAALQALPGLGPFFAGLVLARATGATDVLPAREPRVRAAAARAAGRPALASDEEAFRTTAAAWRPWRTWACVLLRADAEASGSG